MRAAAVAAMLCLLVSILPPQAAASTFPKPHAFQMREDFGAEPLSDCYLQYYYYIPCPTYSWFWCFYCSSYGDKYGAFFCLGDVSMQTGQACDPLDCHRVEQIRILDCAGYGTIYPGLFTVIFDVWCCDEDGCPIGPALWSSGPFETNLMWTYIPVDPPLCITACSVDPGPPPSHPRILVTATHVGTNGPHPTWGYDNVSMPLDMGCEMHDISSLEALYPRPYNSHYESIHSGYYGVNFQYCPPRWIRDGYDTSVNCDQYGFLEMAWRIYLSCAGPSTTEPSTWGNIKSMYR